MISFKLLNGDLDLTNNKLSLVSGDEKIKQSIMIRLKTWLGEWFLDNTKGVDYYNKVFFDSKYRSIEVENMIRDTILGTEGVVLISSYSQILGKIENKIGSKITISFTCKTVNNTDITVNNEVLV